MKINYRRFVIAGRELFVPVFAEPEHAVEFAIAESTRENPLPVILGDIDDDGTEYLVPVNEVSRSALLAAGYELA